MLGTGPIKTAILPPAILLAAALLVPVPATAAAQVEISSLSDIALGNWGMTDSAPTAHIDICVYSTGNTPSGGYALMAAGTGGFVLKNGTQQLPYSVSWDDGGAGNLGGSSTSLSNSTKLTGQINANTSSQICLLGLPTARLNLKIATSDLSTVLAGQYTGTLTLTLSPN